MIISTRPHSFHDVRARSLLVNAHSPKSGAKAKTQLLPSPGVSLLDKNARSQPPRKSAAKPTLTRGAFSPLENNKSRGPVRRLWLPLMHTDSRLGTRKGRRNTCRLPLRVSISSPDGEGCTGLLLLALSTTSRHKPRK